MQHIKFKYNYKQTLKYLQQFLKFIHFENQAKL